MDFHAGAVNMAFGAVSEWVSVGHGVIFDFG